MTIKIEYRNSFHNTTARVVVADDDVSDQGVCGLMALLSKPQIRRVKKALCGMSDCCCPSNFWPSLDGPDRFGRFWCGGGRIIE